MSFVEALERARIVAIVRRPDVAEVGVDLFHDLHRKGVRAVEFTLDQPGALGVIEAVLGEAPPDMVVGGGTVTTLRQIEDLLSLGAAFAVSPHLAPGLVESAGSRGLPLIPGVATGTEIATALQAGAEAVKLFPAGPLGLGYLSALRGPFPDVAFIPTGGVDLADVPAWLGAGATCVGLGAALTGPGGVPSTLGAILDEVRR